MKKSIALLLIAASTVLSVVISMAFINYGAMELGALIYLIVPVIIGIFSSVLFFLLDHFLKNRRTRVTVCIVALNIFVGILMRLDFYWQIFNW